MTIFRFSCQDKQAAKQVKACRNRLYRLAFSWCHDAMLADDLAQETLSRAMQKLDQLKNEQALDAWLFAILNNQWREYLRKKRPCEDIDEMVFMHDETPEYWHNQQQIIDQIRNTIGELPLSQRQVLTLVDLESMSYAGVAEVLEIPVGTVMSRLNRARKCLQEKLEVKEKQASIARLRSIK